MTLPSEASNVPASTALPATTVTRTTRAANVNATSSPTSILEPGTPIVGTETIQFNPADDPFATGNSDSNHAVLNAHYRSLLGLPTTN